MPGAHSTEEVPAQCALTNYAPNSDQISEGELRSLWEEHR